MNINKRFKLVITVVLFAMVSAAYAAESKSIVSRIAALKSSVMQAHGDSQISNTERDSLLNEWKKLSKLYASYYKDKKLSATEKKMLDSKIKKFDLNLFRKKYD